MKAKEMRLGCLMQALVKRDLWQRVEDVDGINRRLGGADELGDGQWGCSVSVSKPVTAAYLQQQDEASLTAFSTASRVSPVRF